MSKEIQVIISERIKKNQKVIVDIEDMIIDLGNETLRVRLDDPRYLEKVNSIHFKVVALSNIRKILISSVTHHISTTNMT